MIARFRENGVSPFGISPADTIRLSGPVQDGRTGLLFEAGSAADLAQKIRWAEAMGRMGAAARAEYAAKYTPERNYRQLMAIYEQAISENGNL